MKKRILWGTILSLAYIVLISLSFIFYFEYKLIRSKIDIVISDYLNENLLYDVNINYTGSDKNLYCSLDNKDWKNIRDCNFSIKKGDYQLYLKSEYFSLSNKFRIEEKFKGSFSSSLDNVETYYLALGGSKKIEFSFDYPENFDKSIYWSVENKEIVSVKENTISGKSIGETSITATLKDGNAKTYKIVVTDLIKPPTLNNTKDYVPCGKYTLEEAEMLDKILESRVKEAGVGTRGGVLAAARFLTLEFPYSIPYFYENGRLVDNGYRPHIDGEGRYYHKGLYLSESKYKTLETGASTKSGPKMWGCDLYDATVVFDYRKNGLDCSGFVTWAMLNGGFDVGDVGAGNYKEFKNDLSDLGDHKNITKEYIKNGNYKVGDFIGRNGHAALIIGIDEENIYIAESLPPKVKANTYSKTSKILTTSNVKYIIEMSEVYPNGDGIYTNMWN